MEETALPETGWQRSSKDWSAHLEERIWVSCLLQELMPWKASDLYSLLQLESWGPKNVPDGEANMLWDHGVFESLLKLLNWKFPL